MNKNKYLILFLLLICKNGILNCQFTFSGQITIKSTQLPVENAEVYHHNNQQTFLSNQEGFFEIDNLQEGKNIFTIFSIANKTIHDTILISNNLERNYALEPLNFNLDVMNVIARKKLIFGINYLDDIVDNSIYAGKKNEIVVMDLIKGNLASNNSRQIYAQVSGLNIYESNQGGLQLNLGGRGLDPNRTANFNTRQNGYDISADVLGYPESYYTPPSEALSEIRIIRGASALQFGSQFGGLIDFRVRKIPSFEKINIITNQSIGSFGAFNTFNYVGYNYGKFSLNAFYNYKSGNGSRLNSNYKAKTTFASLEYKFNHNTKLAAEYTYYNYLAKQAGGLTDQQFNQNPRLSTRSRNWFAVDWNLFNLKAEHKINNSANISINLFALKAWRKSLGFRGDFKDVNSNPITAIDEQDENGNYLSPRDLILGSFQNYGAEAKFLNKYTFLKKKGIFLLGSKYYNAQNTAIQGPGSTLHKADFSLKTNHFLDYVNQSNFQFPNKNLAFFTENIIYLNEKLSIVPGFRWEYIKTMSIGQYNQVVFDNAGNAIANKTLNDNRILSRNFTLFGLGLSYKKSKRLELIGNLSQNYRSVTFSDIRVVSPTFIVDPNISDERGYTADIGVKGKFQKCLSYELTLYSLLYNDRIGLVLDNRANRVRKNIGKALIAGNEGLINLNLTKWLSPLQHKYNLSLFINSAVTYSKYLDAEDHNIVGNQVEFVPNVNIKSGLSIGYKKFELSYQISHISSQFTDAQNSRIAINGDNKSGIVGEIPAYTISDLTATFNYKKFNINLGINNLLNSAYFTQRATGYPGPGIIPADPRSYFATFTYRLES